MINSAQLKCLVVGDSGVGKTSLLSTYATRKYPTDHVPTVFDNFIVPFSNDNKISHDMTGIEVTVCDTSSQDGYTYMRQTMYPTSDIIIVCYAVDRPQTLENVTKYWIPEIQHFQGPRPIPIVLVGTKSDLRDKAWYPVSRKTAAKVAKKCKAVTYMECSALKNIGLTEIFENVCAKMLDFTKHKKSHNKHRFISDFIKRFGAKFSF